MKLHRFLSIYYAQMITHFVFLCLAEGLLYIFDVNVFLMIYLFAIGIGLEFIYLGQQYMKKFRYYKEMTSKIDMLDQKNMLSEMMERPEFFEGEFIYDILQTCNKSMNDEILRYRTESAGYREYIEMWIHEVKTPLAAAKLIIENHPSEITEAMNESLYQINYYLEQALYYARSNSVEKDYLVKELNLKDIIQKAVRSNAKMLISNKIKIDMKNLDLTRMEKMEMKDIEGTAYTLIAYSKALRCKVRLVIWQMPNGKKKLFFSTDTSLSGEEVLLYYRTRFQIEFCFRDAKGYTGLMDCQTRDKWKLDFAFNASFTSLNVAKVTMKEMGMEYSMSSFKSLMTNIYLVRRIFKACGYIPNRTLISKIFKDLSCLQRIAA